MGKGTGAGRCGMSDVPFGYLVSEATVRVARDVHVYFDRRGGVGVWSI